MKDFSNMKRNFEGIQFEKLRKVIDHKYNTVHDELSDCYYNKKSFRTFGVLTKEQFDKLHGLIFLERDMEFHVENLKQPAAEQYPEEKYNEERDRDGQVVAKRNEKAAARIAELKAEGFELNIE